MQDTPYEDAIDLLDADHKQVQLQFIDYQGMGEEGAPQEEREQLLYKICTELKVHTQLEEEIFYPAVRAAIGDDQLMDHAQEEHDEAKELIAEITAMDADDELLDAKVQELQQAVMKHVAEEREQVFLKAKYSALDLRGLAPRMHKRKLALMAEQQKAAAKSRRATA